MVPKPLMDILSALVVVARPSGTKASDGYSVGTSRGRPSGTKASDGYSVSTSGGMPIHYNNYNINSVCSS